MSDSVSPSKLATLQRRFGQLVRGNLSAREFLNVSGESPSPEHRFALYAQIVRNNHLSIVNKVYAFCRASVEGPLRASTWKWDDMVSAYLRDCPPGHWEPNQVAAEFADWLQARAGTEAPWLWELAQYEWAEFATYTAPDTLDEDQSSAAGWSLEPTVNALACQFGIGEWVKAKGYDSDRPPEADEHVLLVFRDARTLQCRFLRATPWTTLAILSLESGDDPMAAAIGQGVSEERARQALSELAEIGLLHRTDTL